MKIAQIKDIENLASGTAVGQITVKLKKVFPKTSGQSQHGTWTRQGFIAQDETGETRASAWNLELGDLEGKTVTFKSNSTKNGLKGVEVKANKDGVNEISISDRCSVIEGNSAPASTATKASVATPSKPVLTIAEVKKRIYNSAQLYVQCANSAKWIADQLQNEDPEFLRSATASMYITAERAGYSSAFEETVKKEEPATESSDDEDDIKW